MADEHDRPVTIDIETATETATNQEAVERIRREAGIEEGEPPPRDPTAPARAEEAEESAVAHGRHDRRLDRALEHRDGPQPG